MKSCFPDPHAPEDPPPGVIKTHVEYPKPPIITEVVVEHVIVVLQPHNGAPKKI